MIPTDILNYRVVRLLGTGGMGSVYLAVNTSIDQQVAIKVLRPELARNPEVRKRFKQEAELLSSLNHPGIVKFLNYVETNDNVYLIMEYVKGVTLEDFINKKNGLIVESKAYPIIKEILDAFEYAHSKGVVHRDIKPANIIIQDDGHVKIMDFGIAQIVSESNETQARVMGTPAYMSPEQIYGRNVDVRSDIYSLGVLIHNMLTGKAPYDSTKLTEQEIKSRVVKEELPRMIDFYPYVSDKIQKVVDKATQKVPEARYQNCGEMRTAVKKAIAPDPISKPMLYGGIAVIAALLIGAFFLWDYYRLKVDYYNDYVEVYGAPKGIGHLSGREAKHRAASYRFETQKGKVRRVSHVNSKGKVIPQSDTEDKEKIVDMILTYSGDGKVDTQKFMNQSGKVLYIKDFDSNLKTCTFKLDDALGTEMTLNSQVGIGESLFDIDVAGKSKISKYILEYDDNGYLTKVEYAGFGNVRVPDGQGIFGRSYTYDKKGRVTEEKYLGKDGKPKATSFGLGKKLFSYNDDGFLEQVEYQTTDGKPSSDGNNCPIVKLTYDDYGNRTSEKYYDVDGTPMIRKDNRVAGFVYEYDDNGLRIKTSFLGIDGAPSYYSGVAGFVDEYDDNGFVKKRSFIDASGNAAIWNNEEEDEEYSIIEFTNDDHGNALTIDLKTPDGKFIDTAGISRVVRTYDEVGNMLTEFYLDEKGNVKAPAQYGYAGVVVEYNPQGRIAKRTYVDEKKKPINLPENHYSYITIDYDVRGNISKMSYFDADGKPVMTNEGLAVAEYVYDENGNEIRRSFYDTKGKPVVPNDYCAIIEYEYDDQGNIKTRRHMNVDGKLMLIDGVAVYQYTYDDRGNLIDYKPLGLSGALAAGQFEIKMKYDGRDNVIERTYFCNNGLPAVCSDGYHKEVLKYNSGNLCTESEYYGVNGKLVNVKGQNFAVLKREYDNRGNKTSEIYYTATGARGTDDKKVHKYYNQYDKIANKVSHQITFGADGKPVVVNNMAAEGRLEYDKRGNIVKLLSYDGYGKKVNGKNGWYEKRFGYNDAGDLTSEEYFALDGKPVLDKQTGVHKAISTYNKMRMIESISLYDTNGKPIVGATGFATKKYKYNNQNQLTEISYYGVDGRPMDLGGNYHREVYYYKGGSPYKCELFDKGGRKIAVANMVNNQWDFKAVGARPQQQAYGWREGWAEIARNCPMKINDGFWIVSVYIGSDYVTVGFTMDSAMLSNFANVSEAQSAVAELLRQASDTPSYITVNAILRE